MLVRLRSRNFVHLQTGILLTQEHPTELVMKFQTVNQDTKLSSESVMNETTY